jgi:hypothetical protein
MKKQTFDPVAYAAERDRQAAERREKYERIKAYENTIRATAPNGSAIARLRVIENNNHRHYTYTDVNGPRDDVYAYVSYLFSTDHVTQCYEHMALTLCEVIEDSSGTIVVKLSKNHYAGD